MTVHARSHRNDWVNRCFILFTVCCTRCAVNAGLTAELVSWLPPPLLPRFLALFVLWSVMDDEQGWDVFSVATAGGLLASRRWPDHVSPLYARSCIPIPPFSSNSACAMEWGGRERRQGADGNGHSVICGMASGGSAPAPSCLQASQRAVFEVIIGLSLTWWGQVDNIRGDTQHVLLGTDELPCDIL